MASTIDSRCEEITLNLPLSSQLASLRRKLDDYLNHDLDVLPALLKSTDSLDRYFRQYRSWWRTANELRLFFITHLEQYRHSLSYRIFRRVPEGQQEQYTAACFIDSNYLIVSDLFPLPEMERKASISHERFYRAVMGRVLESKALQLFATLPESEDIEDAEIENRLYDKILGMWSRNSDRTLQECFEILEIFDYTSNFLLFQVFPTPEEHLDWADTTEKDDIMADHETLFENWMDFHDRLQLFLTPFDIVSLFNNGIGKDDIGTKTSFFLFKWLHWNKVDAYEDVSGMGMVENGVSNKLSGPASEAWDTYRTPSWRSAIRGRVFADGFDATDFIVPCEEEARFWWERLRRADISPEAAELSVSVPRFWFIPLSDIQPEGEDDHFYILDHVLTEMSKT